MSTDRSATGPARPTSRRAVAVIFGLLLLMILGLVAMTESLRLPSPATGPADVDVDEPAAIDPLRQEVECEVPEAREGEQRPVVTAEPALPVEVTSNQLYDCPATYEGRRVRYTGEVVGTLLERSDRVWTQLNDDVYARELGPLATHGDFRGGNAGVGVRLTPLHAVDIEVVGGPGTLGDLVQVVGTFQRVDPDSGEVAVIVAETAEVIRQGSAVADQDVGARPAVAIVAAVAALALVVIERRRAAR